jgi:hypothetical protein
MTGVVYPSAVRDPAHGTLDRAPCSVRRTSHIDMHPRGTTTEGLGLQAAARDLRTEVDGSTTVVAEASLLAELGSMKLLRFLESVPARPELAALIGQPVARGFRAAATEAIPGEFAAQTPLALLVDDLPVAVLISGYADLYVRPETPVTGTFPRSDICAGWAHDATMIVLTKKTGFIPLPEGPEAPALERDDDPLAWHELPPMPDGTMRRQRLVDVRRDGDRFAVAAMFRDTHVHEGVAGVLHEYSLDAVVEDGVFTSCVATPRALPWPECPSAAASAGDIVGVPVGDTRELVRADFRGTRTCTHLNDLLCTLADVAPLLRALPFSV